MKLGQKLSQVTPFLLRHLIARSSRPYEQVLRYIGTREDIWLVSQGEYMLWWLKRERATLKITVNKGYCHVSTSLENAVVEKFPGEFLVSPNIPCEETEFSGEVWITLHSALKRKELLFELLKREGIFNVRVADEGEFTIFEKDVGPLLEEISAGLQGQRGCLSEEHVRTIRQIVIDKLAAYNLPLLRIWYHPQVDGVTMRAGFSPRFDVDRAITNLPHIRALERKYDVSSTLYLRVFCPFYTTDAIKQLASQKWCSEIALHGEFITFAHRYGDEFNAAEATKAYLEKLTERSVLGVAMHGGELSYNRSENTNDAIRRAKFLYDTTLGPLPYYFPYKKVVNGQIGDSYNFPHALSDVNLFPFKFSRKVINGKVHKSYSLADTLSKVKITSIRDYNRMFYEKTVAKMDEVYEQNGIFVITLHPAYFGFFSYLTNPRNWGPLFKYLLNYFRQSRQ